MQMILLSLLAILKIGDGCFSYKVEIMVFFDLRRAYIEFLAALIRCLQPNLSLSRGLFVTLTFISLNKKEGESALYQNNSVLP